MKADDVRMRKHHRPAAPARLHLRRRAGGQGDQAVGLRDEDVKVRIMGAGIRVMRVAQVVHCVQQRLAHRPERLHQRVQPPGLLRVEAELDMENVELAVMIQHPGR